MSCFGDASLCVCGCHDTATALTRRVDGVEASRPRRRHRRDRETRRPGKFKFIHDAASGHGHGEVVLRVSWYWDGHGRQSERRTGRSIPTHFHHKKFRGLAFFFLLKAQDLRFIGSTGHGHGVKTTRMALQSLRYGFIARIELHRALDDAGPALRNAHEEAPLLVRAYLIIDDLRPFAELRVAVEDF